MGLDSTCFAIGENIPYLVCLLNSPVGHYLLRNAPKTGTGDLLISVQAVNPILVPKPIDQEPFEKFLHINNNSTHLNESKINRIIYGMYGFNTDEINLIESM